MTWPFNGGLGLTALALNVTLCHDLVSLSISRHSVWGVIS